MGDLLAFPGCDLPVSTVETKEVSTDVAAALDNIADRLDELTCMNAAEYDEAIGHFKELVAELPDSGDG